MKVTGTVISDENKSPIPGVKVVERGTNNQTITDLNGKFTIMVNDSNSILEFLFIGMFPLEYKLKGRQYLSIILKAECIKEFFDTHHITFYANTGIIHNPISGQLEISSPGTKIGTFKSWLGYQTNLDKNKYLTVQIELSHLIVTCDFDLDIKWNFRNVSFDNDFNSKAYSLETDLNFDRILQNAEKVKFIVGYSNLEINKIKTSI